MLGMITLSESTGSSGIKFNCKLIIDGQQRIITLALILAAAREQLESAADAGNKAAGKVAASLVERLYEVPPGSCFRALWQLWWQFWRCIVVAGSPATPLAGHAGGR